jgi:hypothetical protein
MMILRKSQQLVVRIRAHPQAVWEDVVWMAKNRRVFRCDSDDAVFDTEESDTEEALRRPRSRGLSSASSLRWYVCLLHNRILMIICLKVDTSSMVDANFTPLASLGRTDQCSPSLYFLVDDDVNNNDGAIEAVHTLHNQHLQYRLCKSVNTTNQPAIRSAVVL